MTLLVVLADKRRALAESDPGFKNAFGLVSHLLGYGVQYGAAIKHSWHRAGLPLASAISALAIVAVIWELYPPSSSDGRRR